MLAIKVDQSGLAFPGALKFGSKFLERLEVFSEKRDDFTVVNIHQFAHRVLHILKKGYLAATSDPSCHSTIIADVFALTHFSDATRQGNWKFT